MNRYTATYEEEHEGGLRIECTADGERPYAELKARATSAIDAARMMGQAAERAAQHAEKAHG